MTSAQPIEPEWEVSDRFANLSNPWFTLIGEHIYIGNPTLDYWRILYLQARDNYL